MRTPSAHLAAARAAALAVVAGLASALALEPPASVFAIAGELEGRRQLCGGAGVMIAADGTSLTLGEAVAAGRDRVDVVLAGGIRRSAVVVRRGSATGAVLLRVELDGATPAVQPLADSRQIGEGDVAWTAGNSFGILEQDGVAALSRGIVGARYAIPEDAPPVRGRAGRMLSTYRGAVLETDAAINDGNHGGPLLDDGGGVVGLVSLGLARERRLGTAVPIHLVCADLGLPVPAAAPKRAGDAVAQALARQAASAAAGVVAVYLERSNGPGNPPGRPRPPLLREDTPVYERERIERAWDAYYHQQQVFYTDQPVSALVLDAKEGLLLTAGSNLHGGARAGRVLLSDGAAVPCEVVAVNRPLDLALLRAASALPLAAARLASAPALAIADPVAVVGRHRPDSWTLATGIVSARDRRRDQTEDALHQTDALCNYGSLGGAVVDLAGDVVGLVVMLGPSDRWPWLINSGVALFVDSATIARALPALREGRDIQAPRRVGLGVRLAPSEDGERLTVESVEEESGAAAAGIAPGDVLARIDGVEIGDSGDVSRAIMRRKLGDRVPVVVLRGGAEKTLEVELKLLKERP